MMEIPDQLYETIKAFLRKVEEAELLYMEGYSSKSGNVYDDAAALVRAIAQLEEDRSKAGS